MSGHGWEAPPGNPESIAAADHLAVMDFSFKKSVAKSENKRRDLSWRDFSVMAIASARWPAIALGLAMVARQRSFFSVKGFPLCFFK